MSASVFHEVSTEIDFPSDEAKIRALWKTRQIFAKTLAARQGGRKFVFYEGPPTANGLPHNGHVLTRVIKDLFPRYQTMRGALVPRKAGWDTHGLPVEVEVEKELRIHGKAAIQEYGVEAFAARCIESVFRYTSEWEKLTEKIGFWVDLDDAYVTYHRSYIESIWWALANLYKKGLLYQGHKVVWWWAQGGTALSSAEVGLGYRAVDDPSVYVAFPLVDDPSTALLVWTTTPWTLPSNMYAAVKADVEYAIVADGDRKLVIAAPLVADLAKKLKRELPVVATRRGSDLVGATYRAPFDVYASRLAGQRAALRSGGDVAAYFRVIAGDFVTLDAGTGIVHVAPAFGEDDQKVHNKEIARYTDAAAIELLCSVDPDGTFKPEIPDYAGKWVKAADPEIVKYLGRRGVLVHAETYRHDYPFCWRADDDPLIQLARPAWYIRTTAKIDRAIANSNAVNWMPGHIKTGRFGDFLANNVDWALSRERFWGTPLPIWINDQTGAIEAIASLDELRRRPGSSLAEVEQSLASYGAKAAEHLIVHKPWIDQITFQTPGEPGVFRRVPDVIDCWFDSGCMPFAQWGFPHAPGSHEKFAAAFPADFISEAIDQTRGWFYSLLMVSTLVFDETTMADLGLEPRPLPHPYRSCLVLGHVSDKEGKKESKSKGNYTPPEVILDRVRMDFAVVGEGALESLRGISLPPPGTALIAREDLEGLDLTDGAEVSVYRPDRAEATRALTLRAAKGLARRLVVLAAVDAQALDASVGPKGTDVTPVEVPRLDTRHRVTIEDPTASAPGADAFRWFFCASSPPWTSTRHALSNVRALQKDFPIKLSNVYSFFTIYARIDGWSPAVANPQASGPIRQALVASDGYRAVTARSLLDRWLLSEVALTNEAIIGHLDKYQPYEAAQRLIDLTEALSNWYVRRSRERFWGAGLPQDKLDAYFTLYEALVTIAEMAAPFTPYLSERMYQNLVVGPWPGSMPESVHMRLYPEPDLAIVDRALTEEMRAVRELVSLGLKVRTTGRLKVRQPLSRADVILSRQDLADRVATHASLIAEELNVQEVRFLRPGEEGGSVRYRLKPNFRALGPKLGKNVQLAKQLLEKADAAALRVEMSERGQVALDLAGTRVELGPEEIEVGIEASDGFAAAGDKVGVVVLHTELTEALVDAGLVREVMSRVQALRKELGLAYTDRIRLAIDGSERIRRVANAARDSVARDALAVEVTVGTAAFVPLADRETDLEGDALRLALSRAD